MTIGDRIRKIRMRQRRTAQEVADACGFTRSLLSKIETNKTVPPLATLSKIAGTLGVKAAILIEEPGDKTTVHVPAKSAWRENMRATHKGYQFHAVASNRPDKMMQPYLFVAEKGKIKSEPLSHAGEEFLYVLEGKLKYRVGAVEYRLGPGDSLYFDAEEEHDFEASSKRAKFLAVFVEPHSDPRSRS